MRIASTGLTNSISRGVFCVENLRCKAVVRLADIGGIVDHHFLIFLFIITVLLITFEHLRIHTVLE
jgi:hypothetical protein